MSQEIYDTSLSRPAVVGFLVCFKTGANFIKASTLTGGEA